MRRGSMRGARREQRLDRLVPGMQREIERAPVHRQQARRRLTSACASSAFSGPRWMSPQAGWNAPISSITRSNGPSRCADLGVSGVRPVSPLKKTLCRAPRITHDDHNVGCRPGRGRRSAATASR